MKQVYTSIDIGTDSIKIAVCQLYNNKLNLLAASSIKSKGLKKGLIYNSELVRESIVEAINNVEEMLGFKIKKVITSISSYDSMFTLATSTLNIEKQIEVTGKDISRVILNAIKSVDLKGQELVNVIPIDFSIDNDSLIIDPKGMVGNVLSTRVIIATAPKKNVYSVVNLLESIGLEVVDISIGGVGDINIFKNNSTQNNISAIINLGYETTNISIYNKNIIMKNSVIDYGSKNIDSDIAYIYKLDINDAIKLKEKFSFAHKKYASRHDYFELKNKYDEKIKVNQYELSEVVMSRLEEILSLARKEINLLTKHEVNYIIVTGGISSMDNFDICCTETLGANSNVGNIRVLGIRNNKFSVAVGNIINFINQLKLKDIDYTMVDEDIDEISKNKNNIMNVINETMLGKVFGYFFND